MLLRLQCRWDHAGHVQGPGQGSGVGRGCGLDGVPTHWPKVAGSRTVFACRGGLPPALKRKHFFAAVSTSRGQFRARW